MTTRQQPLTPQRVEHALLLLAQIIASRDAVVAARLEPIYDRLERELVAMRRDDIRARAQRLLAMAQGIVMTVQPKTHGDRP